MLLTYALGRGLEYYDMPFVRAIVKDAARTDYRFSSLVLGIVKSAPFQMEESQSHDRSPRRPSPAAPCFAASAPPSRLPLLDSMVPALTALAQTPAAPTQRFGFVYVPHGSIMREWTPAQEGAELRVLADPQAARAVPRST